MPDNGNGFPIVGAKFRPPALAVLQHLGIGTFLIAEREPDNAYDANAIKVLVASIDVVPSEGLEIAVQNYGKDLLDVYAERYVHLGYIPRTDAVALAAAMDRAHVCQVRGTYTHNLTGQPRIRLEPIGDDDGRSRQRAALSSADADST